MNGMHLSGGQRTTCRSWLSASTMWVLALELRLLGLVAKMIVIFIYSTMDLEAQLSLSGVMSDILS